MNSNSDNKILELLDKLDSRLSAIEDLLDLKPTEESTEVIVKKKEGAEDELEFKIGQNWFAKVGIFVFLIGGLIFLTLKFETLPQFLPGFVGFVISLGLLGLSTFWRKSLPMLSGYILGSGLILLFVSGMRFHFFSLDPTITNPVFISILLYLVTLLVFYFGFKRNSSHITSIGLFTGYLTGLLSNHPYQIFFTIFIIAVLTTFIYLRYNWSGLLITSIVLAFLTHLIWFAGNPILGNEISTNLEPVGNLLFILAYQIAFFLAVYKDKEREEDLPIFFASSLISGIGFGLFLLITYVMASQSSQLFSLMAAITYITIAVFFWTRRKSKISTFFFAMTAYAALSTAIIFQFENPNFFIWLCWQSLLVVSTAVWFRSRFIIVANFIIYLMLFFAYLAITRDLSEVSLSFGLVALLSARILNWRREKLELQTEMMRNAYLITGFLIIPYALYQMIPAEFVSFAWIGVALTYYVFSMMLKNKKYRWMSLGTYLLTAVYVIINSIVSEITVPNLVSFVILGVALVLISVAYAKKGTSESKDHLDEAREKNP